MKKQLSILQLFLFTSLFTWSQSRNVQTSTPCDKEMLKKIPGRWMPIGRGFRANISKQHEQEFVKRLDEIQKIAFKIYPEPMAFDAVQSYATGNIDFASQLKIETTPYGTSDSYINGIPITFYGYYLKFCEYFCGNSNNNEYFKGAGCETGTTIGVTINDLGPLFVPLLLDKFYKEIMRIDGKPIQKLGIIREKKWKNYEVYAPESGSGENMVMIHRDGVLPYIPVTRKQYLERTMQCLNRQYDEIIKGYEQPEGFQLLMSKKERDEEVIKSKKIRDDLLKYYKDELEATTRAGLLDSPAIITGFMNPLTTQPIFTTQANGGNMLVTENPSYFRKDLPKYIPQLIIYSMRMQEGWSDPTLNPYHLYYQNFPIEKLQAMIDK